MENDLEFELHVKSLCRYIAHYEYYGRLPFKKDIDTISFVNSVKIILQNYTSRFFVYSTCSEVFESFTKRLHSMVVREIDSFGHFLQLLPLTNVFVFGNQVSQRLDAKLVVDKLAQSLKAYDKELKLSEITTLFNINAHEPFLNDKDLAKIQKDIKAHISDKSDDISSSSLLNMALHLKKLGKSDQNINNMLKNSSDLLLIKIDENKEMHRFMRNTAGLLNLDMASPHQFNLINDTLINNIELVDVNSVQYCDAILDSGKISDAAKLGLRKHIREMVLGDSLRYNLRNPQIQKLIKMEE